MAVGLIKGLERRMTEQLRACVNESRKNEELMQQELLCRESDKRFPTQFLVRNLNIPKDIISVKIEIFPNETEEPHFKVTYKNCSCRFKIKDCQPMKAEQRAGIPTPIRKIIYDIESVWEENYDLLVNAWNQKRPQDKVLEHQMIKTR